MKALYKAILKLITGEKVYYGPVNLLWTSEEILKRIFKHKFIHVKNEHNVSLVVCTDKIVGCFEYKKSMYD